MDNPFTGNEQFATGDEVEFLAYHAWEKGFVVGQVNDRVFVTNDKIVVLSISANDVHLIPELKWEVGKVYKFKSVDETDGTWFHCIAVDRFAYLVYEYHDGSGASEERFPVTVRRLSDRKMFTEIDINEDND